MHGESVFGVDKGSRVGEISLYIMSIVASCVVVGGEDEIWEERTKSGRRVGVRDTLPTACGASEHVVWETSMFP